MLQDSRWWEMAQIIYENRDIYLFGVPTGFLHSYLVFREDNGTEWVISAYLEDRDFRNEGEPYEIRIGVLRGDSPEANVDVKTSTVLQLPSGMSTERAWQLMAQYAREIDQSNVPYTVDD